MGHPATLLLSWVGYVYALQSGDPLPFVVLALLGLLPGLLLANRRCRNLLRRARWLILWLCLLYLFATPGEYLPGVAGTLGLTYEGVQSGAMQVGRLVAMLASLAWLHETLGTQGILAGLHWVLRPLPWREVTIVRLLLVLELAERRESVDWRQWMQRLQRPHWLPGQSPPETEALLAPRYRLTVPAMRWPDVVWLAGVLAALVVLQARAT